MKPVNFLKNKKVLVAGGAGFIGSNLIEEVLRRGAVIRATLHKKEPYIQDPRIEYVWCDLTQKEDCRRVVEGIDYAFMCAAYSSGAAEIQETPLVHVTPNVLMATLMLDAAYHAHVKKFLWISSSVVYPETDHPVKEVEMMSGPLFEKYFFVGWMKRFVDILCQMYGEKIKDPMNIVIVRPAANIYGAYDNFEWRTAHVIPALIRKVVERHDPVEVWGTGEDVKDLIYVKDFIDGMLLATEKINTFDSVNISSGLGYSIKEIVRVILQEDGYTNARIVFDPSKPTMIPKRILDVSKAKQLLGFEARTTLQEGIHRTIEWFKKTQSK